MKTIKVCIKMKTTNTGLAAGSEWQLMLTLGNSPAEMAVGVGMVVISDANSEDDDDDEDVDVNADHGDVVGNGGGDVGNDRCVAATAAPAAAAEFLITTVFATIL